MGMFNIFGRHKFILGVVGIIAINILINSCLADLPDDFPNDYKWEPSLAFPIGSADFGLVIPHGFDTLLLEIDPERGIPYWDLLDSIPLSGSIDFDFAEVLGDRDSINFAVLRVNAYNGFPIEIVVQAYLKDGNGNLLDSLFTPKFIMQRGELSSGGQTSLAVHTAYESEFDPARLDLLLEAKKITFQGKIKSIPYFPNFTFRIQLGARLEILPKQVF